MKHSYIEQTDKNDCGPTCIKMIAAYYNIKIPEDIHKIISDMKSNKSTFYSLCKIANKIGFKTEAVRVSHEVLKNKIQLPCIAHWNKTHFIVVNDIDKNGIHVADPVLGLVSYSKKEFLEGWQNIEDKNRKYGIILIIFPEK